MIELKKQIKKCLFKVIKGGKCPMLSTISAAYKDKYQIPNNPFQYRKDMTNKSGKKIADLFQSLKHEPNNKLVKAAYEQLVKEVVDQFVFILEHEKIYFEPYQDKGEPYKNSFEMLLDIHKYHLYFFKTESGFGEYEINEDNIMLRKTGLYTGDYEFLVNDIFRIVHDVFGHAMEGNSFGPIGEDLAWFTHLTMFSPLAAAAITTETRGQNCWVNFGPHMRDKNDKIISTGQKGWLAPENRPFAEQKMNLLPSAVSGIHVYEAENVVKANYLPTWDPFLNLLTVK